MKFSIDNYKKTKQIVIDKIKSTHNWRTDEGFIADGLISPETYIKSEIKIAFFLGESYGYHKKGVVDIESQLQTNILGVGVPKRHTATKIPVLLWLIFESLCKKEKVSYEDFPSLLKSNERNKQIMQKTISNIAWINVKKASKPYENSKNNSTRQSYKEIYDNSIRNKEVLKLQIDSIKPNLMIVCSKPVFNSLFEMGLLGEGIKKNQKFQIQMNSEKQLVIYVSHPSYLKDWGYKGIYNTFEIIYSEIKNGIP